MFNGGIKNPELVFILKWHLSLGAGIISRW